MGGIRPRGLWRGSSLGWEFPLAAAEALIQRFGRAFRVEDELLRWLHWHRHPLPPLPHHRDLIAQADLTIAGGMAGGLSPINDLVPVGSWRVVELFWPMKWDWVKR